MPSYSDYQSEEQSHFDLVVVKDSAVVGVYIGILYSNANIVSFPDPTSARKGSGNIGVISWLCATSRDAMQTYANCHMTAELAEPRTGTNVPRPFPHRGWVWERD